MGNNTMADYNDMVASYGLATLPGYAAPDSAFVSYLASVELGQANLAVDELINSQKGPNGVTISTRVVNQPGTESSSNFPFNVNPTKLIVSLANAANVGRLYAAGFLKLGAGSLLTGTGAGAPVGVVALTFGTWNLVSAQKAWERSIEQWNGAFRQSWSDATLRNLYGVLPMGQDFDDPWEPTPAEVYRRKARRYSDTVREIGTIMP